MTKQELKTAKRVIKDTPYRYFRNQFNLILALDLDTEKWLAPLTYGGGEYTSNCLYISLGECDDNPLTKKQIIENLELSYELQEENDN